MASKSMKDVQAAIDSAIDDDGSDNIGKMGGPTSSTMYGPGDGVRDDNREDYINAQKLAYSRGTDSDIQNMENNKGRMGVRMDESGSDPGSPDPAMAHAVNQAWMIYNKAPTDQNAYRVGQALKAAHIKPRSSSGGEDYD